MASLWCGSIAWIDSGQLDELGLPIPVAEPCHLRRGHPEEQHWNPKTGHWRGESETDLRRRDERAG